MPRLPDASALGERRISESGRPIAQVDLGAPARALEGVGRALSNTGANIGQYAAKAESDDLRLNTARADAAWLAKDTERRNSFKDEDPDYQTWGDRYQKGADEDRKQIAEQYITDPRARELWTTRRQTDVVRGRSMLEGRAEGRNRDYYRATGNEMLDNLKKTYIETGDDETMRQQVVEAGSGVIDDMRKRGIISEDQARGYRQQWVANVVEAKIDLMAPEQRIDALRGRVAGVDGVVDRIFGAESGGTRNPDAARNPNSSAVGAGQFIKGTWLAMMKQHRPDLTQGQSDEAILALRSDRGIMREMTKRYAEGNAAYLTKQALPATVGNIYLSHFLGPGGAVDVLKASPDTPVSQLLPAQSISANRSVLEGKTAGQVTAWAERKMGGKGSGADLAQLLPEERRVAKLREAEGAYATQVRQQEGEKRQQSADIEALKRDDLAAVENKGAGLAPETLSRAKIAQIQGEEAARVWEGERARARRVFEATDGIQTLPEGEIYRRLETLEPRPNAEGYTTEGYADDMRAYERAQKRADRIVQARRSDPALAAEGFDTVKRARASIEYDEDRGVRMIRPESAQSIIGARLAAQSQMGLEQPMAVTKSEASVIARNLRAIGEENPDGLRKFMEGLNRTYGDYADEVLAATIQHANVGRDLSVLASQLLTKVASGTMPKTAEMRNIDALIDAASLENLMKTGAPETLTPPLRTRRDAFGTRQQMMIREQAQGMAAREQQQAQEPPPVTPPAPALATQAGIADIRRLTQDPSLATEFETKYGPGTAAEALKRWRNMTGR